jgi:hypothetical protein
LGIPSPKYKFDNTVMNLRVPQKANLAKKNCSMELNGYII